MFGGSQSPRHVGSDPQSMISRIKAVLRGAAAPEEMAEISNERSKNKCVIPPPVRRPQPPQGSKSARKPHHVAQWAHPYALHEHDGRIYHHGMPHLYPHKVLEWNASPRIDTMLTEPPSHSFTKKKVRRDGKIEVIGPAPPMYSRKSITPQSRRNSRRRSSAKGGISWINRDDDELEEMDEAALKIQKTFRKARAQKALQERREERQKAQLECMRESEADQKRAKDALAKKRHRRSLALRKDPLSFTAKERKVMNVVELTCDRYVTRAITMHLDIEYDKKVRRHEANPEQVKEYHQIKTKFMMAVVNACDELREQMQESTEEEDEEVVEARRRRLTRMLQPFVELLIREGDADRSNVSLLQTLLRQLTEVDWPAIITEADLCHDAAVDGSTTYVDTLLAVPGVALTREQTLELTRLALTNHKKRLKFSQVLIQRALPIRLFQHADYLRPVFARFLHLCTTPGYLKDSESGYDDRALIVSSLAVHHVVGIDFVEEFDDGHTLVSRVCASGDVDMYHALYRRVPDKVELALIHASTADGMTPFMHAVHANSLPLVEELIQMDVVLNGLSKRSWRFGSVLEVMKDTPGLNPEIKLLVDTAWATRKDASRSSIDASFRIDDDEEGQK